MDVAVVRLGCPLWGLCKGAFGSVSFRGLDAVRQKSLEHLAVCALHGVCCRVWAAGRALTALKRRTLLVRRSIGTRGQVIRWRLAAHVQILAIFILKVVMVSAVERLVLALTKAVGHVALPLTRAGRSQVVIRIGVIVLLHVRSSRGIWTALLVTNHWPLKGTSPSAPQKPKDDSGKDEQQQGDTTAHCTSCCRPKEELRSALTDSSTWAKGLRAHQ